MTKRLRVYPSSAAFMWGRVVFTEYASGCLRRILLDANGVREPFNPIHSERGELNEDLFEEKLRERGEVTYQREKPFRESIPTTSCQLSGRIDFNIIYDDPAVPGGKVVVPHELKSTESESQRKSRIQYGKWGLNNVAQLVVYLLVEGVDRGVLQYTFFERTADGLVAAKPIQRPRSIRKTEAAYDVRILGDSYVEVGGSKTQFTAFDVLDHVYWAAKVIEDDIVWERPANYDLKFGSPCTFCPFKNTCNKWDNGVLSTASEFIEDARCELSTFHEE